MDLLRRILAQLLRDSRHKTRWRILSTVMAAVVVFVTTYSLILPAITLEENAAHTMDGLFLEPAGQSAAQSADGGFEDFQVVSDDEDAADPVFGDGSGADAQHAPLIESVLTDGQQPEDIPDGILEEDLGDDGGASVQESEGAVADPGADSEADLEAEDAEAVYAEGVLTASGVLLNDVGGLDEIRLEYDADAMIPEGTVCIAQPFGEGVGASSADVEDQLAQRYEQAVRDMVAAAHPDWTNVRVRMFCLQLKKDGVPVAAQKKLDVELTAAQPLAGEHAALLHFKNNDPNDELQEIDAGQIENVGSVHIDPPVEMKKAQLLRDTNGQVSLLRYAAKKLDVFAVVTADVALEEVSAPAETEAAGSTAEPQSETEIVTETEAAGAVVSETEFKEETEAESEFEEETEAETEFEEETEAETEFKEETEAETEFEEETEAETEFTEETETEAEYPAQEFSAQTDSVDVYIFAPQGAFPAGTTVEIADVDDDETIAAITDAASTDQNVVQRVQAVDITFRDAAGVEIEPLIPIRVEITAQEKQENETAVVVHVDNEGNAQTVETAAPMTQELAGVVPDGETIAFDADAFSVYAIVYTVEFHWEVDGKEYVLTLPGGGFVSFEALMEVLGVADKGIKNGSDENQSKAAAGSDQGNQGEAEAEGVEGGFVSYGDDPAEILSLDDVTVSEETKQFVADVENVIFSNPDLVWVGKAEEDIKLGELKDQNRLTCIYSLDLSGDDILKINDQMVYQNDWAIISLQPFTSEEALTVTMKNGDTFTIKVTDAQSDAIMIGDVVQTIPNPSGTTIDLFDYWVDSNLENDTNYGRNDWPNNGNWYWYNPYNDNYNGGNGSVQLYGQGNNSGINRGHAFKFTPAQAGSVIDGTLGTRSIDANDKNNPNGGVNSWTHGATPRVGIVEKYLNDENYPVLTTNTSLGTNGEDLNYLFNHSNDSSCKQSYPGVNQLLYVDPDGYYTFNSHDFNAAYNNNGTFTLTKQTAEVGNARGFWPFGNQAFWCGMHMHTNFSMPANGQVLNPKGEYKDMTFEFQGDDDTWLYLDGILVGDGGGIHNQTFIRIDFKTGKVLVSGEYDAKDEYKTTYHNERYLDDIYREGLQAQGKTPAEIDAYIAANFDGHTYKQGTKHEFDMFYLERGGGESNLYIHYNLVSTTDFSSHKSYHMPANDPHGRLMRDQFKFELIGYDNTNLGTGFQQAIMPNNGTPDGAGTFASPKKIYHETTANSEGYTSLEIGVTEDGNVNFGDVQVQASQAGMTYRYMVRELVDPDAVNEDGISWADANEEQRAEGGFTDANGVTYDAKVYYFTGTVQETSPGSGQYEVKKTRYTDSTYTTVDTATKFFSFVNGHIEPIKLKVLKKSESGKNLSGAEFSLVRAKHEVTYDDHGQVTSEKWVARPESTPKTGTTANGSLTFNGLKEGHYILEETAAPTGYVKNDPCRWLLTMTMEDTEDTEEEVALIPTITPLDAAGNIIGGPQTLTSANHVIEYAVLNGKLPRGPITVEKKWLKPDGTTEYTTEELSELQEAQSTAVTGELWRRYLPETVAPIVRIFAKKSDAGSSTHGEVLWSGAVASGSDFDFMVGASGTGNPLNYPNEGGSITTSTGATVTSIGSEDVTYSNGIQKSGAKIYEVKSITEDTDIYVVVPAGRVNDQGIGYKIKKRIEPEAGGQPVEQKVGDFTLDNTNSWKVTWTSEQLNEGDYDYEYYLKNVSEPSLEGFAFVKEPEISVDTVSGTVTYSVKNIKEGPMTDLTVRKMWGDRADHSGDTISYKIRRTEYDAQGVKQGDAYDYIEAGKTAAEVYTLSASDSYNDVAWQKHHSKLPATNGKEETDPDYRSYEYSVVEVNPPANYIASYLTMTEQNNGNPYDVTVIRNEPADARVSVEKKWMDNGKANELTEGIPDGAYITGTLKKSYTWQEPSGTTVRVYNRLWNSGQILSTTLYRTYSDVQDNSDFNLWAIDSNGNEPLNGVQANGSPVAQTGSSRSYNMGGWSKSTNAYVFRVNGQTDVILDWAYNTGFQNGWHYDVDYTQASGGGQSHDETETVGTFRLDAANGWKWVWTDRELDQDHVYTYFFENVQEHSADGTVVANFDGFKPPEGGNLTQGTDGRWTATIVNEKEPPVGNLTVTKELTGDIDPAEYQNTVFKVTVQNAAGQYLQSDKVTFGNTEVEHEVSPANPLVITGLRIGKYIVQEKTGEGYTDVIEGYTWTEEESVTHSGNAADMSVAVNENATTTVALKNPYIENYTPTPTQFEQYKDLEVNKVWEKLGGAAPGADDEIEFKVVAKYKDVEYVPFVWELYQHNNNDTIPKVREGSKYVRLNQGVTVGIKTTGGDGNQAKSIRMNSIIKLYNQISHQELLPKNNQTIPHNGSGGSFTSGSGITNLYGNVTEPELLQAQPVTKGAAWVDTLGTAEKRWTFDLQFDQDSDEIPDYYDTLEELIQASVTGSSNSLSLKYTLKGSTLTPDPENAQLAINPETAAAQGAWSAKLTNLPTYQVINVGGQTRYRVYSYSIEEIKVNGQPVVDNKTDQYNVSYASSDSTDTNGYVTTTATITNTEIAKINVDIVKVEKDHTETKLPGATFTLRELEDALPTDTGTYGSKQGTETKTSAPTADTTGKTFFTELGDGYYELKELQAPDGYIISENVVTYFKIEDGEVIWLTFVPGQKPSEWKRKAAKEPGELISLDLTGGKVEFIVENTPGAALPNTGGSGTAPFTIPGSLLLLGAGVLLWRRRRLV